MKKKLFIVIPTLGTGGGEKLVVDIARNINKEKFDLKIICLFSKKDFIYERILEENSIKIIYMNKSLGFDLKVILNLIKLFILEKPDIVHTHLNVMQFVLPAMIISKVKVRVHTVHSIAEKESIGVVRKIMNYSYKFFGVKPVAICDYVKTTIIDTYKLKEDKIICIYNGVDREIFFKERKHKKESLDVNFISVGTLYKVKNHKLMIDAFSKINKEFPMTKLTIIGDGELREELKKQIKDYNLENKIILKGIVNDVSYELNKADIFLMTSNYEGLPLSILEAMACGLPIIATKAGGIVDVVKHDINGLLVNVNNEKELIESMKELLKNNTTIKNMSKSSMNLSKNYDIKRMINQYEIVYSGGFLQL